MKSKEEIEEEIMRTVPPGTLYGPVVILDGIPEGWIECDGQNGTPDLRTAGRKNKNYVMKV